MQESKPYAHSALFRRALSPMPIQPRVKGGGGICVPVYKADRAGEPETFRYTAQVMPIETVNITSRISTDLVKVGFKDGEYVEKGRLLYTFDDTRYAAMYKSDKSKIEEYEAKLIYARNDYERTNELFKKGVSTKDEMESSLSQYKSYQASLLGPRRI